MESRKGKTIQQRIDRGQQNVPKKNSVAQKNKYAQSRPPLASQNSIDRSTAKSDKKPIQPNTTPSAKTKNVMLGNSQRVKLQNRSADVSPQQLSAAKSQRGTTQVPPTPTARGLASNAGKNTAAAGARPNSGTTTIHSNLSASRSVNSQPKKASVSQTRSRASKEPISAPAHQQATTSRSVAARSRTTRLGNNSAKLQTTRNAPTSVPQQKSVPQQALQNTRIQISQHANVPIQKKGTIQPSASSQPGTKKTIALTKSPRVNKESGAKTVSTSSIRSGSSTQNAGKSITTNASKSTQLSQIHTATLPHQRQPQTTLGMKQKTIQPTAKTTAQPLHKTLSIDSNAKKARLVSNRSQTIQKPSIISSKTPVSAKSSPITPPQGQKVLAKESIVAQKVTLQPSKLVQTHPNTSNKTKEQQKIQLGSQPCSGGFEQPTPLVSSQQKATKLNFNTGTSQRLRRQSVSGRAKSPKVSLEASTTKVSAKTRGVSATPLSKSSPKTTLAKTQQSKLVSARNSIKLNTPSIQVQRTLTGNKPQPATTAQYHTVATLPSHASNTKSKNHPQQKTVSSSIKAPGGTDVKSLTSRTSVSVKTNKDNTLRTKEASSLMLKREVNDTLKKIAAIALSPPRCTKQRSPPEQLHETSQKKIKTLDSAMPTPKPQSLLTSHASIRPAGPVRRPATKNYNAVRNKLQSEHDNVPEKDKKKCTLAKGIGSFGSQVVEAQQIKKERLKSGTQTPTTAAMDASQSVKPGELIESEIFPKRLIKITGRRKMDVLQVEYSWDSLRESGMFILDLNEKIILWKGSKANRIEQAKGHDVANRMKSKERAGRAIIIETVQGGEDPLFLKELHGPQQVSSKSEDEASSHPPHVMYFVDQNNTCREIARGTIEHTILNTYLCFILDAYTEVWAWIGQGAPSETRKITPALGVKILQQNPNRPSWVKVNKVPEGLEPVLFKEKFRAWPDTLPVTVPAPLKSQCASIDTSFDTSTLFHLPEPPKEYWPDDGSGDIIGVWLVKEFSGKELPKESYGCFFSGESYVILYRYHIRYRELLCVYFWQGRDSVIVDKGTAAALTKDIYEKYPEQEKKQIRVVQNVENKHFLAIFRNRYIVRLGQQPDGNAPEDGVQLFHFSGDLSYSICYPIQVRSEIRSLNTNDCFILRTPDAQWVWRGEHVKGEYLETTIHYAKSLFGDKPFELIEEGKEPAAFWGNLTGAHEYMIELRNNSKLLQCSMASGKFEANEVFQFCNDDLAFDDMMLLISTDVVYVWEGRKATEIEKKRTIEIAAEYISMAPTKPEGRIVRMDREPLCFRSHFHGWDMDGAVLEPWTPLEDALSEYTRTYTVEELRTHPKHLDCTKLETYLSDSDFFKTFGMTKEDFGELNEWRKKQIKERVGLF